MMDRGTALRVHYPLIWNDFTSTGVLRKVQETVETWTKLGAHVRTSIISRDPRAHDWATALVDASACAAADAWSYASPWTVDAAMRACFAADDDHPVDVVYARFDLFLPSMVRARRQRPIVLEVNRDQDHLARRSAPDVAVRCHRWRRARDHHPRQRSLPRVLAA